MRLPTWVGPTPDQPAPPVDAPPDLELVGYRLAIRRSNPATGPIVTVVLDPVDDGESWLIDRSTIAVSNPDPADPPEVRFYQVGPEVTLDGYAGDAGRLCDQSISGNLRVHEYVAPIPLAAGDRLVVIFTGVTAGQVGTVRVDHRLFRRPAAAV